MRIEKCVLNASPIICLSKSGLDFLLPSLFTEIVIPSQVFQEISIKPDPSILSFFHQNKVTLIDVESIDPRILAWDLGAGESSVIMYSMCHPDFFAVLDDHEARSCAIALRCRIIGTLGIVILARKRNIISSVYETIQKIKDSGLWISDKLMKDICRRYE